MSAQTMTTCPRCGQENKIVNQCRCDPNNLPTTPIYVGRYARSVETGWLGRITSTYEERWRATTNGPEYVTTMCVMEGVNDLYRAIKGGHIEDAIDKEDVQHFSTDDLQFLTLV